MIRFLQTILYGERIIGAHLKTVQPFSVLNCFSQQIRNQTVCLHQQTSGLFLAVGVIFLVTVLAAVKFLLFIGQIEDMVESLLDGCDAAGIFAVDDVDQLFGKLQLFLFHDLSVTDDVDCDRVINPKNFERIF